MNKDKFLYTSHINWQMNALELFQSWVPELADLFDQTFKLTFKGEHFSSGLADCSEVISEILCLYI